MISEIRNPWIRRPVAVLWAAIYIPLILVVGLLGEVEGYVRSIEWADFREYLRDEILTPLLNAWRGRNRG